MVLSGQGERLSGRKDSISGNFFKKEKVSFVNEDTFLRTGKEQVKKKIKTGKEELDLVLPLSYA